jgi:hypothetical protein
MSVAILAFTVESSGETAVGKRETRGFRRGGGHERDSTFRGLINTTDPGWIPTSAAVSSSNRTRALYFNPSTGM